MEIFFQIFIFSRNDWKCVYFEQISLIVEIDKYKLFDEVYIFIFEYTENIIS